MRLMERTIGRRANSAYRQNHRSFAHGLTARLKNAMARVLSQQAAADKLGPGRQRNADMIEGLRKVIKRMHYPLSLRHIEEMCTRACSSLITRRCTAGL